MAEAEEVETIHVADEDSPCRLCDIQASVMWPRVSSSGRNSRSDSSTIHWGLRQGRGSLPNDDALVRLGGLPFAQRREKGVVEVASAADRLLDE